MNTLTFTSTHNFLHRRALRSLAVLLAACSLAAASARAEGTALAKIGGQEVSLADIRDAFEHLTPEQQARARQNPATMTTAVQAILMQKVVFNEALSQKWDQQPDVLGKVERARKDIIAESYLMSVTKPADDYPGEAELRAVYEANKNLFQVPRQLLLAQIFIMAPEGADKMQLDAAQHRVENVQNLLKQSGSDFAAVASTESDDRDHSTQGGELGWHMEAQLQPDIRGKVQALAKGAISEPIRLKDGWHLIKVADVKDAYVASFAEVKDQLVQKLRRERLERNRQDYFSKLIEQKQIAVNATELFKALSKGDK